MSTFRRVSALAVARDKGLKVSLEALIQVEPGVLTKEEIVEMKKGIADRLMLMLHTDTPFLSVNLSDIKVSK